MTDTTHLASSVRDLPLEPGGEVTILLTSNGVRLRGVDGDRVTVRARGGADIDAEVAIDAGPGRVQIRNAERGLRPGPLRVGTHGGADLDIEIPKTARLSCKTLSGDVDAMGVGPESRWSSASGDLRLVVGGGTHSVDSMSGDVTIEATGTIALRARSVSGDLRIRAPRIVDLGATTTSGDIRVEADLAAASEHQVNSVSGDVEVITPSPVRIETQTIAGDVRASGTHTAEGGRGRRTLVVGDGSVRVSVRTTSGDIRLRGRGAAVLPSTPATPDLPVRPTVPKPPPAPEPAAAAEPNIPPVAPEPPVALEPPDATYVVAEAEAAPNLVRPAAAAEDDEAAGERVGDPGQDIADHGIESAAVSAPGPWRGAESTIDRREAARLDILRALERGELDIDAASHRLEQLEDAGPRYFRGVVLMAADPLDQVLRLVADGRLTAEEAAPILAALDETPAQARRSGRTVGDEPPGGFGFDIPPGFGSTDAMGGDPSAAPRSLRIEVRESGRQVVNVRLPLAVGRFALDRVPGLSGEQVDRVREALQSGFRGPVLVVDEGDSGVRILLE